MERLSGDQNTLQAPSVPGTGRRSRDASSRIQRLVPFGPVAVNASRTPSGYRDLEGLRQSILYFHNLFIYTKDSFHIEDQLVDGEKVVTRMTAHVQIRETGEPVTLLGINIARIVDGKLVEEWNTWEQTKATERLKPAVLSA
jgi:hypothetical protein